MLWSSAISVENWLYQDDVCVHVYAFHIYTEGQKKLYYCKIKTSEKLKFKFNQCKTYSPNATIVHAENDPCP